MTRKPSVALVIILTMFCAFWGTDRLFIHVKNAYSGVVRAAASCNTTDIQTQITASADGDTITVPNGNCTWTTGFNTAKQIWIRALNYTPTPGGSLTRNVNITNASTTVPLFGMTSGNSFNIRITGIKFIETASPQINHVNLSGSGTAIPILDDDTFEVANRFGNEPGIAALALGSLGGLSYNTMIVGVATAGTAPGECCPDGASVHIASPLGWYTADTFGTADTLENQNWYFEDSTWKNFGQGPDCDDNCRIVMRHMTLDGISGQTHGLTSSTGGRQVEVYNNLIEETTSGRNVAGRYWWGREGGWYIHDNTVAYQNQGFGTPVLFNSIVECGPGVSCANDGSVAYPHLSGTGGAGTGGQQLAWTCNPCTGTKGTSTPVSRPVYIWNNCIAGHSLPCNGDSGGNSTSSPFFIQTGRDICIDGTLSGGVCLSAPAGYTPAPYPHPLRGGPSIGFSPGSVAFGNVLVGSTSPATLVTLTNPGTSTLAITSIALGGTNPTDFIESNNCGANVNAGGSCTITVQCHPASAAAFSANVTVTDSAAGSPHIVGLTCTGITATAGISFTPTSLTFSAQAVGSSSAPQSVTVTNTGGGALAISLIQVSGGNATSFTQANNCPASLGAGLTCTINVTFKPQVAGALASQVCVTDNAPASPQCFGISGTGSGTPGIAFNPTNVNFPNTTVGATTSVIPVTVSNPGSATTTFTFGLTGTNAGDFTLTAGGTCTTSLTVGSSCVVNLTATPSATGARIGALTFTDNAVGSPHSVALSVTGTQSGTGFSPTSLSFGNQNTGSTSAPQTVTLTNTGSATLNISSIATSLADYVISSKTCGATLGASLTCTVGVTFTPSIAGSRLANLVFTDDAPGSPQSVPLTGTGVSATNTIAISPSSITFPGTAVGQVSATQTISVTANVANPGPVTFTSVVASGGNASDFIVVNGCTASLAAGNTCQVTASFKPTASGARASNIVFTDSATSSPQSVPVSGNGTQAGAVVPPTLVFPDQPVGTSSGLHAVNLQNNGTATLHITNIVVIGPNQSYFVINSSTCGATLAAGITCSLNVVFTPATAGSFTATLQFNDDGPNPPQTTALSGNGTATNLTFNPSSLTFPNTPVGSPSTPLPIVVTNTGNGTVAVTSIAPGGVNASNFAENNNCGSSIGPNSSCTVNVTFTPSAVGSRTANITFTDSAPGSPQTVSLQGQGFTPAPAVGLSTNSLAFGNQTVSSQSNPQVVIVTNTGTAVLNISTATLGGAAPGDYGFSTTCGATLAVNASCSYSVHFTPTSGGSRTANFNINTNAASSPDVATLTGTGTTSPPGAQAPQVFGE